MKKYIIAVILFHLFTLNVMHCQSEIIGNRTMFHDKSIYFINDSIKALVMNSFFFIEELAWRFNIVCMDSVWTPTRLEINQFEDRLLLELCQKSLVSENIKSYFRQYFGFYCGNEKMIFAVFRYDYNIDSLYEVLYIYKSFIQIQFDGYITYFHVLFEFPDKLHEIHFNPY